MSTFQQIRWNSLGEGLGSGVGMVSQELQNRHWAQGAKRGDLVQSHSREFGLYPKGHEGPLNDFRYSGKAGVS